ncbi:MAG: InlB B-repeat-containing protein, partial [Planctomycetota bacterium]
SYLEGAVVTLKAIPEEGYRLQQWEGTDNDSSPLSTNTVTMTGPMNVTVTFGPPGIIMVGQGDLNTIQDAVDESRMFDTILIPEGVYSIPYGYPHGQGIDLGGRSVTLKSIDPDAPAIIDCEKTGRAFIFQSGEDANTVIRDIIIRNGYAHGPVGTSGNMGGTIPSDPNDPNSDPDPNAGPGGNAYGDGFGGAILCTNGSSPTFENCTITNCLVAGAIGGEGGSIYYTILTEPEGDGGDGGFGFGDGYGGAITCTENSNPTFKNCTITGNRAVGGVGGQGGLGGEYYGTSGISGFPGYGEGDGIGGGVYALGSTPMFINCTISDNIASDSDDIVNTADEDFYNVHFQMLSFSQYGLGYYDSEGTGYGGGAYYGPDAAVDFNNCTFANNRVRGVTYGEELEWNWPPDLLDPNDPNSWTDPNYIWELYETDPNYFLELYETYGPPYSYYYYYGCGDGAGLCCAGNNIVELRDCTFAGNRIGNEEDIRNIWFSSSYDLFGSGDGGALYCGDYSRVTIDNCAFHRNSNGIRDYDYGAGYRYYGYGLGGAIFCGEYCDLNINESSMICNVATDSGGGLHLDAGCVVKVNDTVSIGNEAEQSGGALHCDANCVVNVTDSPFASNKAVSGSGGAIYLYETDANIVNCPINNNTAIRGGGLYWTASDPNITDCTISGNVATGNREAGGGFYCIASSAMIERCVITENSAPDGFGGGGYTAGLNRQPVVKNCLITSNFAGYNGGGFYADLGCKPTILNCTVADNSASGDGGGLYCTNNGEVTVKNSIIWGNTAEDGSGQIGLVEGAGVANVSGSDVQGGHLGQGNIDADPCFVGDYYLDVTSQCVDAGIGDANDLDVAMDQYTTRTDNIVDAGRVDMGYHHHPYYFRLNVSVDGRFGLAAPLMASYSEATVVTITAAPERGYKVERWNGTDDDASAANTNTVIMDSDRTATVEFEFAGLRTFNVPGSFEELQSAIDAAKDGDEIILNVGTWQWGGF